MAVIIKGYDGCHFMCGRNCNYSAIQLEYATLLLALAKRHMSNTFNVVLHASMTPPMHVFAAWLNSCKKCYIFVTTILTLHVVCDKMIHMYESFNRGEIQWINTNIVKKQNRCLSAWKISHIKKLMRSQKALTGAK